MLSLCPAPATASLWLLHGKSFNAAQLALLTARLGRSEQARLQRFIRPQRARQFLLGRLLLRHAIGQALSLPNADISLTEREHAAPLLSLPQHVTNAMSTTHAVPHFSLSHSHDWIACVLSRDAALGIDIEDRQQPRDLPALASAAFDSEQQAWLQQLPPAQQPAAFYRLWNCQEALYKLGTPATPVDGSNCRLISHPQLAICLCSDTALARVDVIQLDQL